MKTIIVLLLACFGMAFSCQKNDEDVVALGAKGAQLDGTWKLVEPASSYDVTLTLTAIPTNALTASTVYEATGRAIVNSYFTKLTQPNEAGQADKIQVEAVGATKVGGSAEVMQFEQAYFTNLKNATRYELTTQGRLRLYYGGSSSGVLVYEKVK